MLSYPCLRGGDGAGAGAARALLALTVPSLHRAHSTSAVADPRVLVCVAAAMAFQRIQFARTKSDTIAKRDGTYIPRDKRKAVDDARPLEKRAPVSSVPSADVVYVPAPAPKAVHLPPNKVLFAQNVPSDATDATLTRLFEAYVPMQIMCSCCSHTPHTVSATVVEEMIVSVRRFLCMCSYGGFREARVHAHKGVGFVEFDNEAAATIAMQALNNFRLSETHVLVLSYAKK